MYSHRATLVENAFTEITAFLEWLDSFDTVLSDCDGVLWLHDEPVADSVETLDLLRQLGKQVFLVTNNSMKTRLEIRQKALRMGFYVNEDHIICPAHSVASYLNERDIAGEVYVIGGASIGRELDTLGIRHFGSGPDTIPASFSALVHDVAEQTIDVQAVVVGFDKHFCFSKIVRAAHYLKRPECRFIATNTDDQQMLAGGISVPEAGPIVAAVQVAAGRPYDLVGKPNSLACDLLVKNHGIVPKRTLMIGDRCDTDIMFGSNCGMQTLMVGTGIHSMNDVETFRSLGKIELVPDMFVDKLGIIGKLITAFIEQNL